VVDNRIRVLTNRFEAMSEMGPKADLKQRTSDYRSDADRDIGVQGYCFFQAVDG